ncbi:hypothetical protein ACFOG5_12620 [Pedobacter fastidiosus]
MNLHFLYGKEFAVKILKIDQIRHLRKYKLNLFLQNWEDLSDKT